MYSPPELMASWRLRRQTRRHQYNQKGSWQILLSTDESAERTLRSAAKASETHDRQKSFARVVSIASLQNWKRADVSIKLPDQSRATIEERRVEM